MSQKFKNILQHIPWPPLLVAALLLGLAPFSPKPHIVEKIMMLFNGTLTRPVDIFDLLFHLCPTALVLCKLLVRKGQQP